MVWIFVICQPLGHGRRRARQCTECMWSDDTYMAAVEWGVATGGSLIQTDSRLYQNRIYGLCTRYGTANLIEIGYDLRY